MRTTLFLVVLDAILVAVFFADALYNASLRDLPWTAFDALFATVNLFMLRWNWRRLRQQRESS